MGKTFANLRDALAGAIGFDEYADLSTRDQADVDTIINAAYLDCFTVRKKRAPRWLTQDWSELVKAPAAATLGLTNGSKVVTGFVFESKYVGSFVRIGDAFYTLGSVAAGPVYSLVEPWSGTTGNHAATVYYNAVAMPGTVSKVRGVPQLLGIGPLAPLPFPESEIQLRSTPSFDFVAKSGRVAFAYQRPRFDPSLITDIGDPRYYHVNSTAVGATFSTGSRFHLYPIPGSVYTIKLTADILPTPLSSPTDEPVLPHDDVDVCGAIMMPLMFERLLSHPLGRRYSGNNSQLILRQAEDARAMLDSFRSVQTEGPKTMSVANGW